MQGYPESDPSVGRFRVVPIGYQCYATLDINTAQYVGVLHKTRESADNAVTAMNAEVKARC